MGGSISRTESGKLPLSSTVELEWAVSSFQGKRETHEDRFAIDCDLVPQKLAAFSVFDGHYGQKAAKHASSTLLKLLKEELDTKGPGKMKDCLRSAFARTDAEILDISEKEDWADGSTGLCAIVEAAEENGDDSVRIWLANAGDCRAIVYRSEGKFEQVTTDHGTQNQYEQRRIINAGGSIVMGRIDGRLNVARGFGDRPFKVPKELVSAKPDVHIVPYSSPKTEKSDKKSKKDAASSPDSTGSGKSKKESKDGGVVEFMVIASDGVWGWTSNEQVARLVRRKLRESSSDEQPADGKQRKAGKRLEYICEDLIHLAMDNGSTDNITVIVVVFNNPTSAASSPSSDSSRKRSGTVTDR